MKKSYKLVDLDCAHCAQKMEDGIKKLEGVTDATVSFLMQKLTIEVDGDEAKLASVMDQVVKTCKKVEPDCQIIL